MPQIYELKTRIPYGLVVRILAFHAGGPGSIPGVGKFFYSKKHFIFFFKYYNEREIVFFKTKLIFNLADEFVLSFNI